MMSSDLGARSRDAPPDALPPPACPSWPYRAASTFTLGLVGVLCRISQLGLERVELHGLDEFVSLLDARRDPRARERGLITVSNHLSIIDDPFIWGALPFRILFDPDSSRWSLGSYDLCYRNKALALFFMWGQTLPTHRQQYSAFGGPFQSTMTQAVRLMSDPFTTAHRSSKAESSSTLDHASRSLSSPDVIDPFSSGHLTYSTNGEDTYPAPSAYASRKHAWIHVFPEGRIHQHPEYAMRYFRWGIARLILEADTCPDIIPMWIEGCDNIMHEERGFPRFLPRLGQRAGIWFGANVGGAREDTPYAELRRRWQALVRRTNGVKELGILTDELKYGEEAVSLRKECTLVIREEILRMRRARGWSDEDPKASRAETWAAEGPKREGRMLDGSLVREE